MKQNTITLIFQKSRTLFLIISMILFLQVGIHGQYTFSFPYDLDVNQYNIYTEDGSKKKIYIIEADEDHIYYVDDKYEVQAALLDGCQSCQKLSADTIVKVTQKGNSGKWLGGAALSCVFVYGIFSKIDPNEDRDKFVLSAFIGFLLPPICLVGAIASADKKSHHAGAGYESLSLSKQKQKIENESLDDFRHNQIGKRKKFSFYTNNYGSLYSGYVWSSDEESVTIVRSMDLLNMEVDKENRVTLRYEIIDYIKH